MGEKLTSFGAIWLYFCFLIFTFKKKSETISVSNILFIILL